MRWLVSLRQALERTSRTRSPVLIAGISSTTARRDCDQRDVVLWTATAQV